MNKAKTGQIIKEARIRMGYTQMDLGDILGVSNKAVSRWEKGESFPDVGILENLATCLNISIEDIVIGESNANKETALAELTRIVRLQARECIRKKKDIIVNIILIFILTERFYFAFFFKSGSSWLFKYDLFFLFTCYLTMLYMNYSNLKLLANDTKKYQRIVFMLTIVSFVISVIFIFRGYVVIENILIQFIDAGNIGPLFSHMLGGVVILNILLFEYTWNKTNRGNSLTIPFFNISTIFMCCAFRDWMGTLLDVECLLRILNIIICSVIFIIISMFIGKKATS